MRCVWTHNLILSTHGAFCLSASLRPPSTTAPVRKWAFETCANFAQTHEVAELALAVLDGQLHDNRTRWTGQTGGFFLAAHQSGEGRSYVTSPDTSAALADAVRSRLTPAHKSVVERLAEHENPGLRVLAARWAAELGDKCWAAFVMPLLEDKTAAVVRAAVGSLLLLSPIRVERWVLDSTDASWTPARIDALLRHLAPAPEWPPCPVKKELSAAAISHVALLRILEVAGLAMSKVAKDPPKWFEGFPSLIEKVAKSRLPEDGTEGQDVFLEWTRSDRQVVRAVGRRLLASQGALEPENFTQLLSAPSPSDRFSAAECVVRMGVEQLRGAAFAVLRGALEESPTQEDLRAAGLPTEEVECWKLRDPRREALGPGDVLRARLLWALRGAPASFAELVALVAERLVFDYSQGAYEPEAEKIISKVTSLLKLWGVDGGERILRLMDDGRIESAYLFKKQIQLMAEKAPDFLDNVRARARDGGKVSAEVIKNVEQDLYERDLEDLGRRLKKCVFPATWSQL